MLLLSVKFIADHIKYDKFDNSTMAHGTNTPPLKLRPMAR